MVSEWDKRKNGGERQRGGKLFIQGVIAIAREGSPQPRHGRNFQVAVAELDPLFRRTPHVFSRGSLVEASISETGATCRAVNTEASNFHGKVILSISKEPPLTGNASRIILNYGKIFLSSFLPFSLFFSFLFFSFPFFFFLGPRIIIVSFLFREDESGPESDSSH